MSAASGNVATSATAAAAQTPFLSQSQSARRPFSDRCLAPAPTRA